MKNRNFNLRDEDTLFNMMRMYNNLSGEFDSLQKAMTRNFDFTVAELQWDKDVRQKLRDERRPANSYNLIRSILNAVIAVELQNRKKVICKPKSGGDNELAQILTQVLLHFFGRTKFDYARTKVFMDSIVAKFGVYYVGWDYQNDLLGELIIESVDPREIMFEPNYSDPLWSKSSYLFRKHSLSLEEILNKFALNDDEMQNIILEEAKTFFAEEPGKKDKWVSKKLKALFSAVYETASGFSSGNDNTFKNYLQWWDPATGKFDVLELHEQRTQRILTIYDSIRDKTFDITEQTKEDDGINFNPQKIEQVKHQYGFTGEPKTDLKNKKFITAVVPTFNVKVNEQPYPFDSKTYVYIPQYCYDYHADPLKAQSLIDDLVDPQSHFNKAQSLKLELLGRYANKGWIMDENAIDGLEEDWSSQRIAPYRRVRAGYINMIRPEEGQTISPDLIRDPMETQGLMKVISNADDEIRGQSNPDVRSGRHFIAKEQQQTRSFSYMFNNVSQSAAAVAELSIAVIQHYVTTQRLFRITQDTPEPYEIAVNQKQYSIDPAEGRIIEKIHKDITIGEYDIEISDTPYTSSAKEIEYNRLTELFDAAAQINPKKADAMLDILVEAGGFPDGQKILQTWAKIGQPDPQQQQQQLQLQQIMQQIQMIMAKLNIQDKQSIIDARNAKTEGQIIKNAHINQQVKKEKINNALNILQTRQQQKQAAK